jgi:hypothetical protein
MAQEIAVQKTLDKTLEKHKLEAEIGKTLGDFLRGYTPEISDREKDILDRRYVIDLGTPLPDFDCKNAKAYAAIDRKFADKPLDKQQKYVAQVCAVGTLQRTEAIAPLINAPHPNLMVLVSAGVVELSRLNEERFVILYELPKGKKLSTILAATKKRPNFEFICSHIIAPIALAIQHLSEIGLPHGNINCDNIYFYNEAILGHCVAEPCGFSQPFHYEPLERLQSSPAGKGEGDNSQDYYALAVVVLYIIYGINHFAGITAESLERGIMKEGAFNSLTRQKDMPEVFFDFFRGLLSQNSKDRWGYKYLKAWLDGKRYNVMPTPPQQEAIRPFEFEGLAANTRREVAHLLFKNWLAVPEILANGQLSSWVAISLRNKELNEFLLNVTKGINHSAKRNDSNFDEQTMRVIAVFDHAGPVRLRKLAFHIDGISSLFADLMLTHSMAEMQTLLRFIEYSMVNFIIEQKNKEKEKRDELVGIMFEDIVARLDRMRSVIRNSGFGFGVERIFYDLNPNVQCISPLLAGKYVANLPALLKTLDQLAPTLSRDKDPIDNHIAAFIASRLNINNEINLSELRAHPELAKNQIMVALKLLSAAQRKARIDDLSGLSHWVALRILPLLDGIRSRTLKRKLLNLLEKSANSGNLPKMAEVFIESGYAELEDNAFRRSMRKFQQNANEIIYYKNQSVIEEHSKLLGTNLAHYVAVAAFALSLYLAIKGGG